MASTAPQKRNRGAAQASQPFLIFWNDDCVLASDALCAMLHALEKNAPGGGTVDFACTDFHGIVMSAASHYTPHNFYHRADEFDAQLLRRRQYIDTISLMRTESFPGFDESITRLQVTHVTIRNIATSQS